MTLDFKKPPELTLFPETTEQEITQNLFCIISTAIHSVPLLRDYGLDMSYMHMPSQTAKTMMIAAIADAVRRYEPRCSISTITFDDDSDTPDHLYPILEVKFNE